MSRARRATQPRYERVPFDWYVEPRWAVEALFDAFAMIGTVGDPACGMGTIPEVALDRGHPIVACDLVDRGYARLTAVADFLVDCGAFAGVENIVCNPPYSYRHGIAEMFVRQAMTLEPSTIAVLVPLAWLSTEMRFRLFAEHTPARILYFAERPSMPPGGKVAELGDKAFKRGSTDFCWVIWERSPGGEYHGPALAQWIPPRDPAART